MRAQLLRVLAVAGVLLGATAWSAWGQDGKVPPQDDAALMKNANDFVDAFHKGDAKALAALWTPDGDYVDLRGKHLKGRAAIEKAFQEFFDEHKGMKLRIDITALRAVAPDVAVEDGTTAVIPPDGGPPMKARYTVVHVKTGGKWMVSSVRDAAYAAPGNHEHLRPLEWLIGEWAEDNNKGETVRAVFNWVDGQNFIASEFTTTFKHFAIGGGEQRIGWDPAAKQIRSWTFESSGGFGEGLWARDGNKWTVKATATLPDGKKMMATNIITQLDADTMSWQSRDRTMDGKSMPDVKEIKLKRVK
jgi:uncharacterized protein (TIGR02246 family)